MYREITYKNKLNLPNVINCIIVSEDNKWLLVKEVHTDALIMICKTAIIKNLESKIQTTEGVSGSQNK